MLISVIIPVYNVIDTLERAVASVVSQDDPEMEIILVDDGSTDQSGQLADQLSRKDDRIRVIHKANGGLSSARNAGIDEARGEFLAFLDSDDEYVPGIFRNFRETYQSEKMDYFIFNFDRVKGKQVQAKKAVSAVATKPMEALNLIFSYNGLDFYAWNKIYHRSLFESVRYPEGKLYEDTMPTFQTIVQASKVVTTDQIGLKYYENSESIVAQSFNPRQMDNVTERVRLHEAIKADYPSLQDKSARRLGDGLLSTAYKLACLDEREEASVYDQQLKEIHQTYKEDLAASAEISQLKRWA